MTKNQVLWKMITELLVEYYQPASVSYGFQNGVVPPEFGDNFIIIRNLDRPQNYLPERRYNIALQQKEIISSGDWEYQVDLYGDNADDASDKLYIYLTSPEGSNYLLQYRQAIGTVTKPLNMTLTNDRENYMTRYMLKFSALNETKITFPLQGIGLKDININVKEIL